MEFKKPNKEDMPVIIISAIFVIAMAVSSATSKTEETGEPLSFAQWLVINLFLIGITIVVDMAIIKSRENKRIENERKKERAGKEMSIVVKIKSGAIGHEGFCKMNQIFENNLFYFGSDIETLYEMVGYEWDGAKYKNVTESNLQGTETGRKRATGMASGAFGAFGAIGSANSVSKRQESGKIVQQEVEEQGSAIVRMKKVSGERIYSFVIECDSEMDKKIRCFNNVPMHE